MCRLMYYSPGVHFHILWYIHSVCLPTVIKNTEDIDVNVCDIQLHNAFQEGSC